MCWESLNAGSRMADFPVDPHLSRTIIASSSRRCLNEVLAIIAMLSVPPAFSRPRYAQKAADKAHKSFASGYGDHLSLLGAKSKTFIRYLSTKCNLH